MHVLLARRARFVSKRYSNTVLLIVLSNVFCQWPAHFLFQQGMYMFVQDVNQISNEAT